ncbi:MULTISPECIES: MerR family transcriptional regulator [unclassified Bacillus (in: firmicutes)]|uniref:MerR family transcriptional regulator n=1 Tax=unclassified Bacillus (in: firmicutes) TaxID=185979 RepID=UPI0008EE0770|nr:MULTISPECIES: MerR family transcriptional regulator [unclassified Bacillus (in: firmicutes)]SFA87337.1 chromosome-anchoring protein RacA [Bacillus sp. UNCCL13]SFQ84188.1 chromosome-anchoring protein RacA [Bacillus sp. cl95]
MNTNQVAELLGVSSSTVKRWVKQLGLQMERNERGHYSFTNDDLETLKKIHEQIQNGAILQEITEIPVKKKRVAVVKRSSSVPMIDTTIIGKLNELETRINQKADSVASYQLLQHRSDIEELQAQVEMLTAKLEILEAHMNVAAASEDSLLVKDSVIPLTKRKRRKHIFSMLFGF